MTPSPPSSSPPPMDSRFLRLVVDVPTFSKAVATRYAPGEDGAVVEYRLDPDLGTVDPLLSGVRLDNGALLTLEAGKLTEAALAFVAVDLRAWVVVGSVLIDVVDEDDELPDLITSHDGGPWEVELWVSPRADALHSLSERIDAVLATPQMGYYTEWLAGPEGERVLAAIVAEAPADDLARLVVDLSGIGHLWAFLPPELLAGWLASRDAEVQSTVVEAAGAIGHPIRAESYGDDLAGALDAHR